VPPVRGRDPARPEAGRELRAQRRRELLHGSGGSIPSNVLERGNNESSSDYIRLCEELGQKPHSASFPAALPEFLVRFLTEPLDLVLDPFAGSNTTGAVAQSLNRRWLAFEIESKYVENSRLRFPELSFPSDG
jgi:site-specific DNA-methyltransferase (cytosine-N4-specific)